MALISLIPTMTSNTSPQPYVASASSVYGSDYAAYKAFAGGRWNSAKNNHLNSWLK